MNGQSGLVLTLPQSRSSVLRPIVKNPASVPALLIGPKVTQTDLGFDASLHSSGSNSLSTDPLFPSLLTCHRYTSLFAEVTPAPNSGGLEHSCLTYCWSKALISLLSVCWRLSSGSHSILHPIQRLTTLLHQIQSQKTP